MTSENWILQQGRRFLDLFIPKQPQDKIDEMMAKLREEMPSPCLLLLGEPQVGKSSVVRSLTQDPNARIGQGDGRPVTESLQLYRFPPDSKVPLWSFLDTPGLGAFDEKESIEQDRTLLRLLTGEEKTDEGEPIPQPHMILICVRADDRVLHILSSLELLRPLWGRKADPLPVLVVQTNLHRVLYPHPMPYPFGERGNEIPEDLQQEAREQLEFQRERVRALVPDASFVVVDLTDPEDEVGDPMFGALALFEAVAEKLPEVTSRFLRGYREAFAEAYRKEASPIILHYAIAAAMTGALPPPVGDIGTLGLSLTMIQQLAQHHKQEWDWKGFLDLLWSLGGSALLWLALRYLARRIPVPILMAPVGAAGAFTLVYSMGELMSWYYSRLNDGDEPHTEEIRAYWDQAQAHATEQAREWLDRILSKKEDIDPKQSA
ncbi:MAG: 50S ribosome-binding GTPase [Myxococcales bacterium]|nr:50S ribosome-binding GTPase [Myxococcales bacterium]MCB9642869.1 50S ribosome-binding GTPase [Myxococcales bacterium]